MSARRSQVGSLAAVEQSPVGVARHVTDLDDGRSIAWAQTGKGPDLLAIHGTLMTLDDMWLGPAPALGQHFRVTAVDRPGHGLSRRRRYVDASPWRQAMLIHEAAQAIGVEQPVILGHSYGGTVALAYAQLYPGEIAGVVALAPVCMPEPRLEQVLFGLRALPGAGPLLTAAAASSDAVLLPLLRRAIFLPQTMPASFDAAFPTALTDAPEVLTVEGEDAVALIPALSRLHSTAVTRVPIRFLGGTADMVVNNALHGQIAAGLLPNARFTWLAGIGHMLHHFAIEAVVAAAREVGGSPAGAG